MGTGPQDPIGGGSGIRGSERSGGGGGIDDVVVRSVILLHSCSWSVDELSAGSHIHALGSYS